MRSGIGDMKKINIQINQAKIMSYEVTLNDEKPEVSATIGLFSGNKKISSFTLTTQNYYSNSIQFELPYELIKPIMDIANDLETILTRSCSSAIGELPAPRRTKKNV